MEFQLVREATQQMDDYVRILNSYEELSRDSAKWKSDSTQQINFVSLAKELQLQKTKIELALSEGNLAQAIIETQSGTELIETIANTIGAS
ncbi:MAG: hypothetical protein ACI93R_001399 [Flavobacteriales bacterium]|jgi:hypothetical protein